MLWIFCILTKFIQYFTFILSGKFSHIKALWDFHHVFLLAFAKPFIKFIIWFTQVFNFTMELRSYHSLRPRPHQNPKINGGGGGGGGMSK